MLFSRRHMKGHPSETMPSDRGVLWMEGHRGRICFCNVKVDHNRFLSAANDHRFHRFIGARVHFLMGDPGRDIDEIAGSCFLRKLKAIAPAHSRPALDDVEDGFEFTMMMCAGTSARLDNHDAGQSFSAPVRARVIAAARVIPGVWGVFGSSSPALTMQTPSVFHSGIPFCGGSETADLVGVPLHVAGEQFDPFQQGFGAPVRMHSHAIERRARQRFQ